MCKGDKFGGGSGSNCVEGRIVIKLWGRECKMPQLSGWSAVASEDDGVLI
jgi:hypothetical protein